MKLVTPTMTVAHTVIGRYAHTLSIVFLLSVYLHLEAFLLMPQIQHLLQGVLIQLRLVRVYTICMYFNVVLCVAPSDPPQELNVTDIDIHEIGIIWKLPQFPNGVIIGFTVSTATLYVTIILLSGVL